MRAERVKMDAPGVCSRRQFMEAVAATMLLPPPTSPPQVSPISPPWWLTRLKAPSDVVDVRSPRLLLDGVVDEALLGLALDRGVMTLTSTNTPEEAWRAVLGSAQKIVLKFNAVGAELMQSTEGFARALIDRLEKAAYPVSSVALVEAPRYLASQMRTRSPAVGWGEPIPLGNRAEPLANYLLEADAVINIGFLKTHQIAGMSGCMKNLSHAVIRRPGLYHADGCAPFVGRVIASAPVSSRLKLNIINALRILPKNGPDVVDADLIPYAGLLMGFDPLATDVIGLSILELERRQAGLSGRLAAPYLLAAAREKVGRWTVTDVRRVPLDGR